ncbi:hypothetical protein DFA_11620 [Cavenderia fasciculata]|uniref:G-patch domain-containing protein n=1 Tax=Cavenderia fasciculata TaxID=261658 RepID=F4QDR2_CACFS|nr:uncharacterized protein DFA_11620 [Cavenderia fasciculata]EGG13859.1 hypothetical protein DFA_11620 [Cavenderia fasciculata]|eukprot:XP_004350567.1 hypothetical protein DFA_11620 [Cavenderia fasciculata]
MNQDDNKTTNLTNSNSNNNGSNISFSFGLNSNNNSRAKELLENNKKRKEAESNTNYLTSIEGTKITSIISDEPTQKGPKIIPIDLQRGGNVNNKNISTTTTTNVTEQKITSIIQEKEDDKQVVSKKLKKENQQEETTTSTSSTTSSTATTTITKPTETDSFNPTQTGLQVRKKKETMDIDKESQTMRPLIDKLDGLDGYNNDEDKFKFDLSTRPDEANQDDYEETPIDIFGKAMLMGMGWKPGQGIGLTNKGVVEPVQFLKRAGRLGLGAQPSDVANKEKKYMTAPKGEDGKVRHTVGLSEKLVPLKFGLQPGDRVLVISGPHEGLNATVESLAQSDRIVIRFKSDELAAVDKCDLQILEKNNNSNHNSKASSSSSSSSSTYSQSNSKSYSSSSSSSSSSNSSSDEPMWIRSSLVVKIISKSLGDGRYYNKKATIVDIIGDKLCIVELDNGKVVDNVKQRMLETAIPRASGSTVIIVSGKHKSRVGTLVERRSGSKKETAIVQLIGDLSVLEFDLDDICQYVGNKDIELMS